MLKQRLLELSPPVNFLHLSSKINNSKSKFYLDIVDEKNHHVHVHCYKPKPKRLYVVIVDICRENKCCKEKHLHVGRVQGKPWRRFIITSVLNKTPERRLIPLLHGKHSLKQIRFFTSFIPEKALSTFLHWFSLGTESYQWAHLWSLKNILSIAIRWNQVYIDFPTI